ncbi:MAG TPA: putative metal-dependent hydrolase [Vicinamibacterales bacterium]
MSDTTSDIEQARYPIGRFDMKAERTAATRAQAIVDIEQLPARMRAAVGSLDPAVIDTPYREGGWTIRQLVHHVADSHMNGYIRLKFTLTEDNPALKGYQEALWAELPDSKGEVETSLRILDGVHVRWAALWRSMTPDQFARTFQHSQYGPFTLDALVHLYGWHSRHHVAHITTRLAKRAD